MAHSAHSTAHMDICFYTNMDPEKQLQQLHPLPNDSNLLVSVVQAGEIASVVNAPLVIPCTTTLPVSSVWSRESLLLGLVFIHPVSEIKVPVLICNIDANLLSKLDICSLWEFSEKFQYWLKKMNTNIYGKDYCLGSLSLSYSTVLPPCFLFSSGSQVCDF